MMLAISLILSLFFSTGVPSFDKTPAFQGQLMQSPDGGETWENITFNLPTDMRIVAANSLSDEILVGVGKEKVYKKTGLSTDQWSLLQFEGPITDNYIDGIHPTLSGFYTYVVRDGFYYLPKGAQKWKKLNKPDGLYEVNSVVEDMAGNLFIASQNGIYRSQDGGSTWEHNFVQSWIADLTYQYNTLIASGQSGVFRSIDQGVSWQKIKFSATSDFDFLKVYDTTYRLFANVDQLFLIRNANPTNKNTSGILQFSQDGGRSWAIHPADAYLKQLPDIQNFAVDAQGNWYCSYSEGIIKSEDQGKTWKALLSNQLEDRLLRIWVEGDKLYCAATLMGC